MDSLISCSRKHHIGTWYLRGLVTALVVLTFQGSSLALEGTSPNAERKPAANRVTTAEAHYELGVSYHEQMFADLDQAIAEYEQAVKLRGDFAKARYYLGLSYHTKAKLGVVDNKTLYRKALKEYKLYLRLLPKGPLADQARQNIRAVKSRLQ